MRPREVLPEVSFFSFSDCSVAMASVHTFTVGNFLNLRINLCVCVFYISPFFFMETALPSCLLFLTVVCQTGAFCPENVNRLYKAAEHPGNPEDL